MEKKGGNQDHLKAGEIISLVGRQGRQPEYGARCERHRRERAWRRAPGQGPLGVAQVGTGIGVHYLNLSFATHKPPGLQQTNISELWFLSPSIRTVLAPKANWG